MNLSYLIYAVLLSVTVCMTVGNPLMAQAIDEDDFILYTKQDGLSANTITGIAQDATGYIWIATSSGINRFDGSNFLQFHSSNDSLSIPAEYVSGLSWLDNHRLAASTSGLHIVDTHTGETRNLYVPYHDKKYLYKFNAKMAACSDTAGNIFILTHAGFYQFDKHYRLLFRFDYYSGRELETTSFGFNRYLTQLDQQHLLVTGIDGNYYYDASKKHLKKLEAADCPLIADLVNPAAADFGYFQLQPGRFIVINGDADSLMYIDIGKNKRTVSLLPFRQSKEQFDYRSELSVISDTLLYITGNTHGFYKMRFYPESGKIRFCPEKYFSRYYCRYLMKDRDQKLWIATNKGLFRQDNSRSHIRKALIPAALEAKFPGIFIDDICISGNKIYVATRKNGGLLEFDKHRFQFTRRFGFNDYRESSRNVLAIAPARESGLLVGTIGPLYSLDPETGIKTEMALENWDRKNDWIADLYKDRRGNIWVATTDIYKWDPVTRQCHLIPAGKGLFENIQRPNSIREDASGNIWLAGHGLLRYNITTNRFDRYIDSFPFIKIPDRQVTAFVADAKNNLWVSNSNNGLTCYNIDKGVIRHFTRDNGLPDNTIADMIIIGNKLWIASYSGIACLNLQNYRITAFGNGEGFPDQPIANGARFAWDTAENKLYIGFTNTMVRFDPDIITQENPYPRLFIESIVTGDQKKIPFPGENITAAWKDNDITVTIGSINFFSGNSQRFAYRLVKEDSARWQQLGARNTFSISQLSSGTHYIQVKLFSPDNRWPGQVKEISITVLPPFWEQVWFRLLCTALLLAAVFVLLKWRTGLIRKKEQAKTHIQELKAEEYKSQFELEQISNYFSSSLAGKKSVDEVLWDVTKNLIARMGYVDCIIYRWNDSKSMMVQKAACGPKDNPTAISYVLPGQGIVGHVMKTREPILVPDTRKDPRYRIDGIMRLSEICVPIIHNNELVGIIDSEHHTLHYFKERDIKILTTIATLVGNKISQIESERSLEIKQQEITTVNQQLAEAQLSALQTQMNPHFIFNSLNSIKGMILDNEQQKASRYLSKFAHMIRITLGQSKEVFTTLCENTDHLESYLAMEKLRFDDSFTFQITVDEGIDKEETLIPSLMIQPLAENAIWHGLMPTKGEKKLSILFTRLDGSLSCIIEDNGIGIKRAEQLKLKNRPTHRSEGLSNLRNRIKILNEKYNTGCSLDITDLGDRSRDKTGTRAILRFNIITNKPYV